MTETKSQPFPAGQTGQPAAGDLPLSGQERHDAEALSRGYDPDASALPDKDAPQPGPSADTAPETPSQSRADEATQAENKGLVPSSGTNAPPLDRPAENTR